MKIKGFERKDIWDYPLEAIREAFANALVHRDYFEPVEIQVKVYDDKISFYNRGGLPEGWDIKKLLETHSSIPRNQVIAHIFYLAGIIERVGSGIERIINSLKIAGLPEPKFETSHTEFNLWFMMDLYTEEYLRNLGLNERQLKAVMYVKERGKIINKEYQEINKTTKKTASRDLALLIEKRIFVKIGSTGKGTYYVLSEPKGDTKGTQRGHKPQKRRTKGAKESSDRKNE